MDWRIKAEDWREQGRPEVTPDDITSAVGGVLARAMPIKAVCIHTPEGRIDETPTGLPWPGVLGALHALAPRHGFELGDIRALEGSKNLEGLAGLDLVVELHGATTGKGGPRDGAGRPAKSSEPRNVAIAFRVTASEAAALEELAEEGESRHIAASRLVRAALERGTT